MKRMELQFKGGLSGMKLLVTLQTKNEAEKVTQNGFIKSWRN
jgi:hypothetical protein